MTTIAKLTAAFGLVLGLGIAGATDVSAKAHNQGATDVPGQDVGRTTVGTEESPGAQDLGPALSGGKARGVADTPAGEGPGSSADPGSNGGGRP